MSNKIAFDESNIAYFPVTSYKRYEYISNVIFLLVFINFRVINVFVSMRHAHIDS